MVHKAAHSLPHSKADTNKDKINISELKKSGSFKNTVVDNNKNENDVNSKGRRVGGEQKRK